MATKVKIHIISQRGLLPCTNNETEGCLTRSSPSAEWRFQTTNCSATFDQLYCLNNGTCFMQQSLSGTPTPFCNCTEGHVGRRCEYAEFIDVYLPIIQQKKLEIAAIAACVAVLVTVAVFVAITVYLYRKKAVHLGGSMCTTVYESSGGHLFPNRPFSLRRNTLLQNQRQMLSMDRTKNDTRSSEDKSIGVDIEELSWATSPSGSVTHSSVHYIPNNNLKHVPLEIGQGLRTLEVI